MRTHPKVYTYSVNGSGRFPVDMLRYDAAWPASSTDASLLADRIEDPYHCKTKAEPIRLQSHRAPTIGRWQSFLWGVSEPEVW